MEAIVEPERASSPGDTCAAPLRAMYAAQSRWYISAYLHHRFLFSVCTSYGKSMSRRVLAWARVIVEAIVEPKRASTPGDTYASLDAFCGGTMPAELYLSLHTPSIHIFRMHLVREKYEQVCVGMV